MLECGRGDFDSPEHAGDFFDACFSIQFCNGGFGAAFGLLLADLKVMLPARSDLRKVCDTQNLMACAQFAQKIANYFRHGATNSAVDLIKIRVGTRAARLAMTDSAKEIRASSPPEATFASGLDEVPACPATKNSTLS